MIELLLGVADRLVKLLELRNKSRRELFVDHVDPIFQDLRSINDDHRKMLLKALLQLADERVDPVSVLAEIKAMRQEKLTLRRDVKRYAEILPRNVKSGSIGEFCGMALRVLVAAPETSMSMDRTPDSPIYGLIDEWQWALDVSTEPKDTSGDNESTARNALVYLTEKCLRHVDLSWEAVSASYFYLRSTHLKQ